MFEGKTNGAKSVGLSFCQFLRKGECQMDSNARDAPLNEAFRQIKTKLSNAKH